MQTIQEMREEAFKIFIEPPHEDIEIAKIIKMMFHHTKKLNHVEVHV